MGFFSAVKRFFGPKEEKKDITEPVSENKDLGVGQTSVSLAKVSEPEKVIPQESRAAEKQESPEKSLSTSKTRIPDDLETESAETDHKDLPSIDEAETSKKQPQKQPAPILAKEAATSEKLSEKEEISLEVLPTQIETNPESREADQTKQPSEQSLATNITDIPEIGQTPAAEIKADQQITSPKSGDSSQNEQEELLVRLREAEPRLSSWLAIILEGQDEVNPVFWERLRFFLHSLEAPANEINSFVADFAQWLERMEYSHIDEFRSELQYRLALALDLEDEEDERNRLMLKLTQGLAATRQQLGQKLDLLFANHGELNDAFWEEMEEMFIMADIGYDASLEIVARLKKRAAQQKVTAAPEARQLLQEELEDIFKQQPRIKAANKPEVILMMGVNGAGKTTTIGKLAHRARMEGKKTLIAAADTFRAAAIEQLQVWAERSGSEFYAKAAGSDPASVAWEAMDYAQKHDIDIVFVDTAGRLQTRVNLMEELGKIRQVLAKKQPGAPHRSMLVLDATTGQNALSQAKLFREAAGADEIALTKLDGTAKGGVAIAVAMQEGLPITFVGLGEKLEDLRPFDGRAFATALLGDETQPKAA